MPPDRVAWARAYAIQSRSDFEVYESVANGVRTMACHRLHYLQMACEKIAKAYRFRDTATLAENLQTRHIGFSRFIESFLMSPEFKKRYYRPRNPERELRHDKALRVQKGFARNLAREIEKLAPAVYAEASPENAEYPWAHGNIVVVPCEFAYPNLSPLMEPRGVEFLRLVKFAIEQFEEIHIR